MPTVVGALRRSDYDACKAVLRSSSLPSARSYYYRPLEIALLILSNRGVSLQQYGQDALLETFIVPFGVIASP